MALPTFNMRQLLEAGVHFGHQQHRWNPKMATYIFGTRNNIHIIDLAQTVPLLHQALVAVSDTVGRGGRVLFVGTKRQASETIADAARRSAQYFVNHRWLGGTLTNWKTISNSIRRLRQLEEATAGEAQGLTKKELLKLTRERDKLERALGGIKDMGGVPDILFVIDTNKESIAIAEARKLGLPVIAVVDSNCDPDPITHPIPGNDDAGRAISLYCDLIAKAAIDGIERAQGTAGIDVGEAERPVAQEMLPEEMPEMAEAPTAGDMDGAETVASQAPASDIGAMAAASEPDAGAKAGSDGFRPLTQPQGSADDLKKLAGIGPVLEQKLNAAGIFHYRQIAELRADDLPAVESSLDYKGRIDWDGWIGQAKALAQESA